MLSRFFSVKNIAFLAGVIILLFIIPKIAGIVMLFYAAYVLACAMDPFVEKLQTKLNNNRTLASIIVVFGGILALFALQRRAWRIGFCPAGRLTASPAFRPLV